MTSSRNRSSAQRLAVRLAVLVSCAALAAVVGPWTLPVSSLPVGQSDEQLSAVIPSPNQDLGDQVYLASADTRPAPAPVYASPFVRSERAVREISEVAAAAPKYSHMDSAEPLQEEAPQPEAPQQEAPQVLHSSESEHGAQEQHEAPKRGDLKQAASYGHGHHGAGHQHGGWLDMGAWTGGKGSFGWYADYPVGKKSHGHY